MIALNVNIIGKLSVQNRVLSVVQRDWRRMDLRTPGDVQCDMYVVEDI